MGRSAIRSSESIIGFALAILFSVNTVFIIIFSAVGVAGNSAFSGSFLIACEALIFILSMRSIRLSPIDYLFGLLVLAATASFATNGLTAGTKETIILMVSIAGYPVCRCACATDRVKITFATTSLCIAIVGAFATAYAIVDQWPVPYGKPDVFGNDSAGTHFLMALGFFVIAAATRKLTMRQATIISALVFVLSIVFGAALVRLTFAALLMALALSWWISAGKQRTYIAMIAAGIIVGAGCGTLIRIDKIPILIGFLTEKTTYRSEPAPAPSPVPASKAAPASSVVQGEASPAPERQSIDPTNHPTQIPPSCMMEVNMRNSLSERKALWQDSFYLMPRAGLFGFGLDGFMKYSCMRGFPPHNSIFQAFIEFGWIGGIALCAMIAMAFTRLIPTARFDETAMFIACTLAFAVVISLAHGRLSRDFVLFSMLGLAASHLDFARAKTL